MQKFIFLATTALFLVFSVSAQEKTRNSFIGINTGISNSSGKFRGPEKTNFAGNGAFAEINYGYRLSKWVGVSGLLRRQHSNGIEIGVPDGFTIRYFNLEWKATMLLIGISGYFPVVEDKFVIQPRALLGPMLSKTVLISNTAYCFGYSLGASAIFCASPRLQLSFSADVFTAKPVFHPKTNNTESGLGFITSFPFQFRTLNTGIGIAYRFSQPMPDKTLRWLPAI